MNDKHERSNAWVTLGLGVVIALGAALGARGLKSPSLALGAGFGAGAGADISQVYLDQCSVCHGADGRAHTAKGRKLKVKDLHSAEVRKHTDAELLQYIEKGKGKNMDGFLKKLGPQECKQMVQYVRQLGKS